MAAIEVVTLGEPLVALVARDPGSLGEATTFDRHVAGAEANVAVGLARLGHPSAFIGRVGDDGFVTAIRRRLRGEGVDVGALTSDPGAPTGLLVRDRRELGPAEVRYYRTGSAGARLRPDDVAAAMTGRAFKDARWLHITGITPALSASASAAVDRAVELARVAKMTISLDLNLRRRLWPDDRAAPVLRGLAMDADVVLGSPDEAAAVPGLEPGDTAALATALLELGPAIAVIKLGDQGALAWGRGEAPVHRAAVDVAHPVDPVGAGDAFCAGFIAARLDGSDLAWAVEVGALCGAAAVAALGDQAGLPDRQELERLLGDGTSGDVIR
ncbi:MAG: sugar kinase [Candidatus Limnocylindrales bacterium]